jgi:hypothetical protein
MAPQLDTFDAILAPLTPREFFADHYGDRVLHVPGDAGKFSGLMSWETLNDLLSMEIWTGVSLKLVLDKKPLPAEAYCRPTVDRNKQHVLAPARDLVMAWGQKGATLVLHEIEDLVGAVGAAKAALEQALGARGMMNLYCSWEGRQAFDTHFDKHDVFAFQIAGEKIWRIYANRFDNPIEHASFQNIPQAFFDENRGAVAREVRLRPGDLLYLPRGTYHDALAVSEASIHLSCGMIEPVGLVWLTAMWELAVDEPLFRANLPRLDSPADEARFRAHVARLIEKLRETAMSDKGMERARALRRPPPAPARYSLPLTGAAAARRYRVKADALKIVRRGADWVVKDGAGHRVVEEAEAKLLAWIAARTGFALDEFNAAFAERPGADRERALTALAAQRLVEPA